jgi:hypothetical protein
MSNDELADVLRAISTHLSELADQVSPLKSAAETLVDTFVTERTYPASGYSVAMGVFYDAFRAWCRERGKVPPSKIETRRMLPANYPSGHGVNNVIAVGNVSLTPVTEPGGAPFCVEGGKLRRLPNVKSSVPPILAGASPKEKR